MKRVVALAFALPTTGLAATSDPGGVASAVLFALGLGFVVWIVISVSIGMTTARTKRNRVVVATALLLAPIAYLAASNYLFDKGLSDLQSRNSELVAQAKQYLLEGCSKTRLISTSQYADPSLGLLIDIGPPETLVLSDAPAVPKETLSMRWDQHRYGESYPAELHKVQYSSPLHWASQINDAGSALRYSRFHFVERRDSYSSSLRVTASAKWWDKIGRARLSEQDVPSLDRLLEDIAKSPNIPEYSPNYVVRSSTAAYVLSVRDVSTSVDRRNWVARARISLADRRSGEVIAEYVGLAASLSPAFTPRDNMPWELVEVCPGTEQLYKRGRGRWNPTEFFFKEVVRYRSPA